MFARSTKTAFEPPKDLLQNSFSEAFVTYADNTNMPLFPVGRSNHFESPTIGTQNTVTNMSPMLNTTTPLITSGTSSPTQNVTQNVANQSQQNVNMTQNDIMQITKMLLSFAALAQN